jgi:hypothetical protein
MARHGRLRHVRCPPGLLRELFGLPPEVECQDLPFSPGRDIFAQPTQRSPLLTDMFRSCPLLASAVMQVAYPNWGSPARRGAAHVGYSALTSRTSFSRWSAPSRRRRPMDPSRLSSRDTASRCVLMRSAMSAREARRSCTANKPPVRERAARRRVRRPTSGSSETVPPSSRAHCNAQGLRRGGFAALWDGAHRLRVRSRLAASAARMYAVY